MHRWALGCFIIALISGMFLLAGVAVGLIQFLFFIALALFAVFLVVSLAIGK